MNILATLILLGGLLFLLAGLLVAEFFLARLEAVWPGLVLPVLTFLLSLFVPLNFVFGRGEDGPRVILVLLLAFFIANLPTFALLMTRYAARENLRRKKQIERMNIQDLHGKMPASFRREGRGHFDASNEQAPSSRRCFHRFTVLQRAGHFAGTQAAGAGVDITGRTVDYSFHSLHVGFPGAVCTSVRVRDFNAKSHALAAAITFCHLTAPPHFKLLK